MINPGNPIDPFVCPRGHHSIKLSTNRIHCRTCRNQGRDQTSWDRSEMVDLRKEDPPLQHDREIRTDGGSAHSLDGTGQTCLQSTLINSTTNPIRLIAASTTSATKIAVLPIRDISISTNPLIHPRRSPTDSAAATVSTKRRCQLPLTYRPSCDREKRSPLEIAPFLPIYRSYLESAQRSLQTDTDRTRGER